METLPVPAAPIQPAARDLHHLYPRTLAERAAWIEANRALVPFALAPLMARYPDLTPSDRDDVTAAGLRALCEAVDNEPGRRAKLSSYAIWLIQFAGRKALAKCGDWKARRAGVFVGSLDAPIETGDGTTARGDLVADERAAASLTDLLDVADESDRVAQLWAWIKANVTPRQFNALRLCFVEGKSNAQTAEALGKSHQAASARSQDGLAALRKAADTQSGRRVARQLFGAE